MSDEPLLKKIVSVLGELGGTYTFNGYDGQEYIVMSKQDYAAHIRQASEQQLDLLSAEKHQIVDSADAVLEKINRDIAIYQLLQEEQYIDDQTNVIQELGYDDLAISSGGKKVRFEPLRGDLPPELQE